MPSVLGLYIKNNWDVIFCFLLYNVAQNYNILNYNILVYNVATKGGGPPLVAPKVNEVNPKG